MLWESSSPYINRFLSADTIVPGYANPQNLNRYSYVTNNPLRYTDPTGHKAVCGEYGQECSEEELDAITGGGNGGGGGHDDDKEEDDDGIELTLTRDGLIEVQNQAGELAAYYQEASTYWEYGAGTATGLLINVPGCVAGGAFTGWTSCGLSVALTVAVVPATVSVAGELGGGMQADTASYLAEQIEDVLINDSSQQFTVTIEQQTNYQSALMLPGAHPIGSVVQTSTINIQGSNGSSQTITIIDASFSVLNLPSSIVNSSFGVGIP